LTAGTPATSTAPVATQLPARFERRAMGSPLRLTVVGVPPDRAEAGWTVVSAAIEEIEQSLSRFRASSDLMALNARAGDPACATVDPCLYAALAAAERAWRRTDGAFDPRVLGDLERLGYAGAAGPGDAATGGGAATARPRGAARPGPSSSSRLGAFPDGRWLHRDPRRRGVAIASPIDLGGIGKGLALRWTFARLTAAVPELGVPAAGALLEAGGDLVARGAAPQPGPWLIGIEDPAGGPEPAIVAIEGGAVCTSSISVHAWQAPDGRHVHHLLDPRTGEPGGDGLVAVTVAAPDPAWAEVWSKALFLEGQREIGPRARSLGLAAWWTRTDGTLEMTPAARERTAWLVTDGKTAAR
jgi:thiamine biosynthesis lipoprotein